IETGPIERNGCPKARTEFPSTQVTVPVAERSMSPERSCVATADPGWSGRGSATVDDGTAAPEGTVIQLAASARRGKRAPVPRRPPKEIGSGSAAMESGDPAGLKDRTSSSSLPAKSPFLKAETSEDVETAAPAIGTGGPAGTCRMSSMLLIGVIPQIGSFENGQP